MALRLDVEWARLAPSQRAPCEVPVRGMRAGGSAGVDMCHVARGRQDACAGTQQSGTREEAPAYGVAF